MLLPSLPPHCSSFPGACPHPFSHAHVHATSLADRRRRCTDVCCYEADFSPDLRVLMRVLIHFLMLMCTQHLLTIGVEGLPMDAAAKPFLTGHLILIRVHAHVLELMCTQLQLTIDAGGVLICADTKPTSSRFFLSGCLSSSIFSCTCACGFSCRSA